MGSGYDSDITKRKILETGAPLGVGGVLLAFVMQLVRSKNPDIPWDAEQDLVLVGAITGALSGVFQGVKNWLKNRGVAK